MPNEGFGPCLRVDLRVTPQAKELLLAALYRFGVSSFEEQTAAGDPPVELVRCYLPSHREAERLQRFLRASLADAVTERHFPCEIEVSEVAAEDWAESWKRDWQGTEVGSRFFIAPAWLQPEIPPGRLPIFLDPEMAFGTGTHETTRMCLCWIEELAASGKVASFLDVGCGSGILSIAAAKLGVAKVMGIDVDETAIRTARANAAKNNVHQCVFERKEPGEISGVYSLVCANIISSVLDGLWQHLCDRLQPSGILIVSGLLVEEKDAWSKRTLLRVLNQQEHGDWLSLAYTSETS